jgi:hypothetical protein
MIVLGIALAALALSLFSLARAWVPPQTRGVLELQGRVEDLEFALADVRQRLTKRARAEGADNARGAFKERRAASDTLLEQAAAVVDAAKTARDTGSADVVSMDKASLRALYAL